MADKKEDRRRNFRGYKGAVVSGDKRAVTAYLDGQVYVDLIALAEGKGQSVSSLVSDAILSMVGRKTSQAVIAEVNSTS